MRAFRFDDYETTGRAGNGAERNRETTTSIRRIPKETRTLPFLLVVDSRVPLKFSFRETQTDDEKPMVTRIRGERPCIRESGFVSRF